MKQIKRHHNFRFFLHKPSWALVSLHKSSDKELQILGRIHILCKYSHLTCFQNDVLNVTIPLKIITITYTLEIRIQIY